MEPLGRESSSLTSVWEGARVADLRESPESHRGTRCSSSGERGQPMLHFPSQLPLGTEKLDEAPRFLEWNNNLEILQPAEQHFNFQK